MSIKLKNIWNILLPLSLLAAGACQHDDLRAPAEDLEEEAYLVIKIALPMNDGDTRSYPTGGEEGDGREEAVLNEDIIHDINLFFYADNQGLDGSEDSEILYKIFYNLDNPEDSRNTKLKVLEWSDPSPYGQRFIELSVTAIDSEIENIKIKKDDHFAVVANAGYISDEIATLGDLRNLNLDKTWTQSTASTNAADMDRFIMSTGFNSEYYYNNRSTGKNIIEYRNEKYSGATTLQRLSARIDLWYSAVANADISANETANSNKINRLTYVIENAPLNKVYIQNVLPVNVMQSGSFLFKKVTKSATGWTRDQLMTAEISWAGKEAPFDNQGNGDRPQNYVLDPYTLVKEPGGSVENNNLWYGQTSLNQVKEAIKTGSTGKLTDYYDMTRVRVAGDVDVDCDRISIISYANENTNPTDCFHSTYLTGLVFRGVYVPAKIYKEYTGDELIEMTNEDWTENFGINDKLYRYSESVGGKVDESKSYYFSKKDALDKYKAAHPSENAVWEEYDYGIENGQYGILCYYNLWLRHYNDTYPADSSSDPHDKLPMEYAIVRNNIYRVALSFSGPGDPTPTMREPDTMQARIFVRKWNLREEGEALEF